MLFCYRIYSYLHSFLRCWSSFCLFFLSFCISIKQHIFFFQTELVVYFTYFYLHCCFQYFFFFFCSCASANLKKKKKSTTGLKCIAVTVLVLFFFFVSAWLIAFLFFKDLYLFFIRSFDFFFCCLFANRVHLYTIYSPPFRSFYFLNLFFPSSHSLLFLLVIFFFITNKKKKTVTTKKQLQYSFFFSLPIFFFFFT